MIKVIANYILGVTLLGTVCCAHIHGIDGVNIQANMQGYLSVSEAAQDQKAVDGFLRWINESVKKYGVIHIIVGDKGNGERFISQEFREKAGATIFIDRSIDKFNHKNYFAIEGLWEDFVRFVNTHEQVKNALKEKVEWVFDDWEIIIPGHDEFLYKPNFGLDDMSAEEKNDFLENVMMETEEEYVEARKETLGLSLGSLKSSMELLLTILKPNGRFFSVVKNLVGPIYSIYCEKFRPKFCAKNIKSELEKIFDLREDDLKPIEEKDISLIEKLYDLYDEDSIVWYKAYEKDFEKFIESKGQKDPDLYNAWKTNPERFYMLFEYMRKSKDKCFGARYVVFTKK